MERGPDIRGSRGVGTFPEVLVSVLSGGWGMLPKELPM